MQKTNFGTLYLVPSTLGENSIATIPEYVKQQVNQLSDFVVEREKSARRFLKQIGFSKPIDSCRFYELDKHSSTDDAMECLQVLLSGNSMGLISEAGIPCVADPGALLVEMAHQNTITIKPLVGPSSIILALSASGLNGQNFCFHGYLPFKDNERKKTLKQMEQAVYRFGQTQIFMETPYRNDQIIEAVLKNCRPNTLFCVACDLTLNKEFIKTMPVEEWQQQKLSIQKRPAIFLLGTYNK